MSSSTTAQNLGIAPSPDYVSSGTTPSKMENGSSPESVGVVPALKPKQSKSRNGCVTCKAKRLKCDESKPTCHQCQKRGVPCGGYKKDFKWRPFEESVLIGKAPKSQRKSNSNGVTKSKKSPPPPLTPSSTFSDASFTTQIGGPQRSPLESCFGTPSPSPYQMQFPSPPRFSHNSRQQQQNSFEIDSVFLSAQAPIRIPSPTGTTSLHTPRSQFETGFQSFSPAETNQSFVNGGSLISLSHESLRSPGPTHDIIRFPLRPSPSTYHQNTNTQENTSIPRIVKEEVEDDEIEEIIRSNPNNQEPWYCPPSPSNISTHSSSSRSSYEESFTSVHDIFRRPRFDFNTPEMLLSHFDKNTCGIMSVKDGPTENPWRTLVWPLATDSPALYHAIASMTAFHMSRDQPSLRVEGIEHMRRSATYLSQGFRNGTIRNDAALATTLVLAFSEAFDRHTSSGTKHLRGAKELVSQELVNQELVNQALTKYQTSESTPEGKQTFTFLYNVWVYLDVLARLTSDDDEETIDAPLSHGPLVYTRQIDPLLGCAATLFPLIGRVANLVQKVRKAEKNSLSIINQAMEIKILLEAWAPENYYETPEDPLLEVAHCTSTAEAYRWATLLYLHQAIPELPSPTAHELAEKVMICLATIPLNSRSCIVHIYPLLAAGCEAVGDERDWVNTRWKNMCARMWIGNVDKAWEVVKEVWDRRDRFQWEQQAPISSRSPSRSPYESPHGSERKINTKEAESSEFYIWGSGDVNENSEMTPKRRVTTASNSGLHRPRHVTKCDITTNIVREFEEGEMEYEVTVRGKLHWVSVMKDRNWEVLLG